MYTDLSAKTVSGLVKDRMLLVAVENASSGLNSPKVAMLVVDNLHKFEPQEPGCYGNDSSKDTSHGGFVMAVINLHEYANED